MLCQHLKCSVAFLCVDCVPSLWMIAKSKVKHMLSCAFLGGAVLSNVFSLINFELILCGVRGGSSSIVTCLIILLSSTIYGGHCYSPAVCLVG